MQTSVQQSSFYLSLPVWLNSLCLWSLVWFSIKHLFLSQTQHDPSCLVPVPAPPPTRRWVLRGFLSMSLYLLGSLNLPLCLSDSLCSLRMPSLSLPCPTTPQYLPSSPPSWSLLFSEWKSLLNLSYIFGVPFLLQDLVSCLGSSLHM